MAETSIVWHYTTGIHFKDIVRDGVIKPATAVVPDNEKPIVWFSLNPEWEETANKGLCGPKGENISLDRTGTMKHGGGLVRIGVAPETAPYDWRTLRELSGMHHKMATRLYRAAIEQGARPGEWRGTFEPVPRSKWVAIEVFHEGAWAPVQFDPEPIDPTYQSSGAKPPELPDGFSYTGQ